VGYGIHVLNCTHARRAIVVQDGEYAAFERVLVEALGRVAVDLLVYGQMSNVWHLPVCPEAHDAWSEVMRWRSSDRA
jgi:putative transposase